MIVFLPVYILQWYLYSPSSGFGGYAFSTVAVLLLWSGYTVFCNCRFGQTIGKWATDLKVVDITEKSGISLKKAIFRESFDILCIGITLLLIFLAKGSAEQLQADNYNFISIPAIVWVFFEFIVMLTNEKRRAIHDYLGGTVVIRK